MREDGILYGELVVLGTDGELPNGNRGRRRSRFQVYSFIFRLFLRYFMNNHHNFGIGSKIKTKLK